LSGVVVQAGTFEERDVTEWAKQRLQDMVVGTSTGQAVVTKCRSITGNANIWYVVCASGTWAVQLLQLQPQCDPVHPAAAAATASV